MSKISQTKKNLPDVANQETYKIGELDWVGMENIELPVFFERANQTSIAKINVYVNLKDSKAKGIHMSRLYLLLDQQLEQSVDPVALEAFLDKLIESHSSLSDSAKLEISFDFMTRRKSLKSDNSGWRKYPISITTKKIQNHFSLELGLEVTYSSTCPCSAALARQLIQEQFKSDFAHKDLNLQDILDWLGSDKGIIATPHSQRSIAKLKLKFNKDSKSFDVLNLIDQIESTLSTPVQTAVKREDEQEFALLNGQNPMFCEDACRKISATLNENPLLDDYYIKVRHLESLHPHDATSVTTKNVAGGYTS